MNKIPKLSIDIRSAADKYFVFHDRSKSLSFKFNKSLNYLSGAERIYNCFASLKILYLVEEQSSQTYSCVLNEYELKNLYDYHMINGVARDYYDLVKESQPVCPFCMKGAIYTVEHHLPKSKYPTYAIIPNNLVPCCRDCNTNKLAKIALSENGQTLHPYYDQANSDRWLYAEVIPGLAPSVRFYVDVSNNINKLLKIKISNHFEMYDLNHTYKACAVPELAYLNQKLSDINIKSGLSGVEKYLKEEAILNERANKNFWKTALYHALYRDQWYLNGGYKI
ncbi:HNH endonuclease [Vibrio cholerae]|nr:HNH endonuclease [Vibrio cholerae]